MSIASRSHARAKELQPARLGSNRVTPEAFLDRIIDDGLDFLLAQGGPGVTDAARRFLLTIALQESGPSLSARYQNSPATTPGPARGWWQFEQGGGVAGVLNHQASRALALKACSALDVIGAPAAVWRTIEGNDLLACTFARLLVLTDPHVMPNTPHDGWDCYMLLWRPGKPHRESWDAHWQTAQTTIDQMG
jgi:hypothetical protein